MVEPLIQEEQWSFHPGLGTVDKIYTLCRVLEGSLHFAQPVHMCFLDFFRLFRHSTRSLVVSFGAASGVWGRGPSGLCTSGAGAWSALPAISWTCSWWQGSKADVLKSFKLLQN